MSDRPSAASGADIEFTKNAKKVIAKKHARRADLVEIAICDAAINTRIETDRVVPRIEQLVSTFNSSAEHIDRKCGGIFEIRLVRQNAFSFAVEPCSPFDLGLASSILDYLLIKEPRPEYQEMSDLLYVASVSEAEIQWHAKARDGFWNKKLRKRSWAIAGRDAAASRERAADLTQDRREQRALLFRRGVVAAREKFDRDVRAEPTCNDFAVSWPHGWRTDGVEGAESAPGMLVPLTADVAQSPKIAALMAEGDEPGEND